jgi:phospholipase C
VALHTRFFLPLAVAATIAACGRSSGGAFPPVTLPDAREVPETTKIKHVVIVIQENRSFDNFFATFPGADGTKTGKAAAVPAGDDCKVPLTKATSVPLTEVDLLGNGFPKSYGYQNPVDLEHVHAGFVTDFDHGKTDGFDREGFGPDGSGGPACTYPYQYVNPSKIAPYWDMAKQYVLGDHLFQVQGSGSFTAHQELIAGGTKLSESEALIDNPSWFPWGCDGQAHGPHMERTAVIRRDGKVYALGGPFPCLTYTTLRDLLDAKSVSWKFYAMEVKKWEQKDPGRGNTPGIFSAFDAIKAVRYSSEWRTNVTRTNLDLFSDISQKRLPAVSWITPNTPNSDHPGDNSDTGPSWVASIVNAIGKSPYWKSTAIVIVWDDWGGLYDHVAPPQPRNWEGGPGFRVPLLIVSPYVKPHVDHTVYEFGSILHFIEDTWGLGTLGRDDKRSTSIGNAFDFNMPPRHFQEIPAKYPLDFFLHQPPADEPPDTE